MTIKLTNAITGETSAIVCGEYDPKRLPRKGRRYRFEYPAAFVTMPEYTAHAGQIVTVLHRLKDRGPDAVNESGVPMYRVMAEDGWQGDAWADELTCPQHRAVWNMDDPGHETIEPIEDSL